MVNVRGQRPQKHQCCRGWCSAKATPSGGSWRGRNDLGRGTGPERASSVACRVAPGDRLRYTGELSPGRRAARDSRRYRRWVKLSVNASKHTATQGHRPGPRRRSANHNGRPCPIRERSRSTVFRASGEGAGLVSATHESEGWRQPVVHDRAPAGCPRSARTVGATPCALRGCGAGRGRTGVNHLGPTSYYPSCETGRG